MKLLTAFFSAIVVASLLGAPALFGQQAKLPDEPDASAAFPPAYQPAAPSLIDILLGSGEPRLVAWGASLARTSHAENEIPALNALASCWKSLDASSPQGAFNNPTPTQRDQIDAMSVILDALLQLNAVVPTTTIRKISDHFPAQASILLARVPAIQGNELRFEFFRHGELRHPELRYVAAALLGTRPGEGICG
jgi:hypothetical protein